MSTIKVTNINDTSNNASIVTGNNAFTVNGTVVTGVSAGSVTVTAEGGTTTTNLQQGLAKAWISMNGTGTIAVRDSFNMTGITDQGVGLTTVTIANNMGSAEYSVGGASGTFIANSDNVRFGLSTEAEAPTSTLFRTITREANDDTNRDVTYSFAQVFGDLA
jgi:hypothetical protein